MGPLFLAEVYRGRSPRGFDKEPYLKAEDEAKKAKKGMWSLGKGYISPKEWRRIKRDTRD